MKMNEKEQTTKEQKIPKPVSALEKHSKRLWKIVENSSEIRWAAEDDSKLRSLDMRLNKLLNDYESLLDDKKAGRSSFSRSSFYHKVQPWDKSRSFRLAPPPVTTANSRMSTSQMSQGSDARLLLSSLPLLQNLKNLQHLNSDANNRR